MSAWRHGVGDAQHIKKRASPFLGEPAAAGTRRGAATSVNDLMLKCVLLVYSSRPPTIWYLQSASERIEIEAECL